MNPLQPEYIRVLSLCVLTLAIAAGCATSGKGWVLKVDNSGSRPIRDVKVTLQDGREHVSPQIAAQGRSGSMPLGSHVPMGKIDVTWTTETGSNVNQVVTITNGSPRLAGQITLEIKDERPMRIFMHDESGQFMGEIPWGNSADWDGSVMFPVDHE